MALFGRNKTPAQPTTDPAVDDQDEHNDVAGKEENIKDLLEDVDIPEGQAGATTNGTDQPNMDDITADDPSTTLSGDGPTIIHPHQDDEEATDSVEPVIHDDVLSDNNEHEEELTAVNDEPKEEDSPATIDIKTDEEPEKDEEPAMDSPDEPEPVSEPSNNEVVEDVDREVNDLITRLANEAEGLDTEINNSEEKIKELQTEIDGHKARKEEIDKKVSALRAVVDGSSK